MFGGIKMDNDLWLQINKLTNDLNSGLKDLRARGVAYADAYRKYRMLLSQELLKLKSDGMPVTIAYDIARGKEEIANAKFEELKTEAYYKSCLEGINVYKMQIKILENQLSREYGNPTN